jgi:hypothetical protein
MGVQPPQATVGGFGNSGGLSPSFFDEHANRQPQVQPPQASAAVQPFPGSAPSSAGFQQPMQPSVQQGQQFLNSGISAAADAIGINQGVAGMFANQALQQFQNSQQPGVTEAMQHIQNAGRFFTTAQGFFNVGHMFVVRKLMLLMCPFVKSGQAAAPTATWMAGDAQPQAQGSNLGPDGLKVDIEDPDLYIPMMAYVTYVLTFGLQRMVLKAFSPEVLSTTCSFALVMAILEVGIAKVGFYVAGSTQVSVLDISANCGCKYVYLSLMVLVRIATASQYVYYPVFAYLSACAAFAVRRFMLHIRQSEAQQQYGWQPSALHGHVILALAAAQIPLCWILTPWNTK